MIIHDEVIHQFIHDKNIDASIFSVYPKNFELSTPNPMRKDVVLELHSQLLPILQQHSLFNISIMKQLDTSFEIFLNNVHIHLVVNAPKPYDIYTFMDNQNEFHMYIDFIQIADQTPIVSRMMFIIQNQISEQCYLTYLKKQIKASSQDYLLNLNYQSFIYGFSTLLSWSNDIEKYTFQKPEYDQRKQQAFGMLMESIQIQELNKQAQILKFLEDASFWDQFTNVAGMFYLYDMYLEDGLDALKEIYKLGYTNFIQGIFQI